MNLYKSTEEMMKLYLAFDNEEITEDEFVDAINKLSGEFEYLAEERAKLMRQLSGEAEMLKAEEDRLYKRRKAKENAVNRMKKSLEDMMIATGKTKFRTELFNFYIQKNAPAVKYAENIDVNDLPSEYKILRYEIDKEKVKEDLKDGLALDFAHLEQSETIRIK